MLKLLLPLLLTTTLAASAIFPSTDPMFPELLVGRASRTKSFEIPNPLEVSSGGEVVQTPLSPHSPDDEDVLAARSLSPNGKRLLLVNLCIEFTTLWRSTLHMFGEVDASNVNYHLSVLNPVENVSDRTLEDIVESVYHYRKSMGHHSGASYTDPQAMILRMLSDEKLEHFSRGYSYYGTGL